MSITIVKRDEWGASPFKGTTKPLGSVTGIVVHHSGVDTAPGERGMKGTQRYHQYERGYEDIAYHYAISEGKIYEGRAQHEGGLALGQHVGGGNTGRIGIVIFGNFTTVPPDAQDITALVDLCHHLCRVHRLSAEAITGHRDHTSSSCPGNGLYAFLSNIRRRVSWSEPMPILPPDPVPTRRLTPPLVARSAPALPDTHRPSPAAGGRLRRYLGLLSNLFNLNPETTMNPDTKKKTESKTWWGVLAMVVSAAGLLLSVPIDAAFIADGWQMSDIEPYLEAVFALGAALGFWGLRTAETRIKR